MGRPGGGAGAVALAAGLIAGGVRAAGLVAALTPVAVEAQAVEPRPEPAHGPTESVRQSPADFDWALRDLSGSEFLLERYRGRPLVLNLWATWCAPCVAELASLDRLARSLETSDVAVLAVSPEAVEQVRSFVRRYPYALPMAVESQRMPEAFGLRALPTTWIVDRSGRIVLKHRGAADWDREEIRRFLLSL